MFGIGLPELILILAIALIVVGPEKLPELAKSIAKGVLELKKTATALKDSLKDEMDETDWHKDLPYTRPENLPSPPPEVFSGETEKEPEKPGNDTSPPAGQSGPYEDDERE